MKHRPHHDKELVRNPQGGSQVEVDACRIGSRRPIKREGKAMTIRISSALLVAAATCLPTGKVYAQDLQLPSPQDLVACRVSCNDPRVTDAPVDPTKLQRFAPGVSSRDFLFIGCVNLRLLEGNRVALPPGRGSTWFVHAVHVNQINSLTIQPWL
jgi:hypothetical protein